MALVPLRGTGKPTSHRSPVLYQGKVSAVICQRSKGRRFPTNEFEVVQMGGFIRVWYETRVISPKNASTGKYGVLRASLGYSASAFFKLRKLLFTFDGCIQMPCNELVVF